MLTDPHMYIYICVCAQLYKGL
uniref:Uncharacterized protein n=1 Tax=Anguilla anguilla TaxID=7936 RepID=A0A0E9V8X3_ANGAN